LTVKQVKNESQWSGKIIVKTKEKSISKLTIPYQANVLNGYVFASSHRFDVRHYARYILAMRKKCADRQNTLVSPHALQYSRALDLLRRHVDEEAAYVHHPAQHIQS